MIYTKKIQDIDWNDIELFCRQQIKEGAYLDYKEDFPNNLEKTLSAMANTLGGIVLIGIEENDDNTPKTPIKGIQFKRGLSEKVTNIILSNISPPFFPEIQICANQNSDKAVVVIRIPQSHQTPHAINKTTKVYLRTGDVNTPEELATLKEIGWLSNQRLLSTNLKDTILQNAKSRYATFYEFLLEELQSSSQNGEKTENGLLTLSVSPLYPKNIFLSPIELRDIPEKIKVPDYYGTSTYFPPPNNYSSTIPKIIQDGIVCINFVDRGKRVFYTELNSFGLYFYRQPIKRRPSQYALDKVIFLSGSEIITRIDEFIDSALLFFKTIGYWGFIDINISLDMISGDKLILDWYRHSEPTGQCPDSCVGYSKQGLVNDLDADRDDILLSAVRKLFWAFGVDIEQENIDHFLKSMNKGK